MKVGKEKELTWRAEPVGPTLELYPAFEHIRLELIRSFLTKEKKDFGWDMTNA